MPDQETWPSWRFWVVCKKMLHLGTSVLYSYFSAQMDNKSEIWRDMIWKNGLSDPSGVALLESCLNKICL